MKKDGVWGLVTGMNEGGPYTVRLFASEAEGRTWCENNLGILKNKEYGEYLEEENGITDLLFTSFYGGCGGCGGFKLKFIPFNEKFCGWSLD